MTHHNDRQFFKTILKSNRFEKFIDIYCLAHKLYKLLRYVRERMCEQQQENKNRNKTIFL